VIAELKISGWYDLLLFTPPFAVMQWVSGFIVGYQLLQIILLSISVIFCATGLHLFFWQVK